MDLSDTFRWAAICVTLAGLLLTFTRPRAAGATMLLAATVAAFVHAAATHRTGWMLMLGGLALLAALMAAFERHRDRT